MNTRRLTVLTALALVLALGEFGTAVMIGLGENPSASGRAASSVGRRARVAGIGCPRYGWGAPR